MARHPSAVQANAGALESDSENPHYRRTLERQIFDVRYYSTEASGLLAMNAIDALMSNQPV